MKALFYTFTLALSLNALSQEAPKNAIEVIKSETSVTKDIVGLIIRDFNERDRNYEDYNHADYQQASRDFRSKAKKVLMNYESFVKNELFKELSESIKRYEDILVSSDYSEQQKEMILENLLEEIRIQANESTKKNQEKLIGLIISVIDNFPLTLGKWKRNQVTVNENKYYMYLRRKENQYTKRDEYSFSDDRSSKHFKEIIFKERIALDILSSAGCFSKSCFSLLAADYKTYIEEIHKEFMLKRIQLSFGDNKKVLVDGFSNNQSFLLYNDDGRTLSIAQTELGVKMFEISLSDKERELPFDLNENEYKEVLRKLRLEKEKQERLVRERARLLSQMRSFIKTDKKCTARVVKIFYQITKHSGELSYKDKNKVISDLSYKQLKKLQKRCSISL